MKNVLIDTDYLKARAFDEIAEYYKNDASETMAMMNSAPVVKKYIQAIDLLIQSGEETEVM